MLRIRLFFANVDGAVYFVKIQRKEHAGRKRAVGKATAGLKNEV